MPTDKGDPFPVTWDKPFFNRLHHRAFCAADIGNHDRISGRD